MTYFLVGDSDVSVLEPDDEFTSLPLVGDVTTFSATSAPKISVSDSGRASIPADNEPSRDTLSRLSSEHLADGDVRRAITLTDDERQGGRAPADSDPTRDSSALCKRVRDVSVENEQAGNTSVDNQHAENIFSDHGRAQGSLLAYERAGDASVDNEQSVETPADNEQVRGTESKRVRDTPAGKEPSGICDQSLTSSTSPQSLNSMRPKLVPRVVKPDYTFLSTQPHAAPSSKNRSKLCTVL